MKSSEAPTSVSYQQFFYPGAVINLSPSRTARRGRSSFEQGRKQFLLEFYGILAISRFCINPKKTHGSTSCSYGLSLQRTDKTPKSESVFLAAISTSVTMKIGKARRAMPVGLLP